VALPTTGGVPDGLTVPDKCDLDCQLLLHVASGLLG
jgi:hypothetical protein